MLVEYARTLCLGALLPYVSFLFHCNCAQVPLRPQPYSTCLQCQIQTDFMVLYCVYRNNGNQRTGRMFWEVECDVGFGCFQDVLRS